MKFISKTKGMGRISFALAFVFPLIFAWTRLQAESGSGDCDGNLGISGWSGGTGNYYWVDFEIPENCWQCPGETLRIEFLLNDCDGGKVDLASFYFVDCPDCPCFIPDASQIGSTKIPSGCPLGEVEFDIVVGPFYCNSSEPEKVLTKRVSICVRDCCGSLIWDAEICDCRACCSQTIGSISMDNCWNMHHKDCDESGVESNCRSKTQYNCIREDECPTLCVTIVDAIYEEWWTIYPCQVIHEFEPPICDCSLASPPVAVEFDGFGKGCVPPQIAYSAIQQETGRS